MAGKDRANALRDLETALLALPRKGLLSFKLYDEHGDVCAMGAYARHKGLNLELFDAEGDATVAGVRAGMSLALACRVVGANDAESPFGETRAMRYTRLLAWVRARLEYQA